MLAPPTWAVPESTAGPAIPPILDVRWEAAVEFNEDDEALVLRYRGFRGVTVGVWAAPIRACGEEMAREVTLDWE
jgi:hypothetical protein